VGDTSGAAAVDYATSNGTATERGDFNTALGRLQFAPGETFKTFVVLINEDSYVEGLETLNVNLSNPSGATLGTPSSSSVTITDDAVEPATNVIDDAQNFVCQHYHDALNRQPDPPGLAHWTGEITECDDPARRQPGESQAQCVDRKRANTSAAFYLSPELQNSANFLIRINWGSLGQDRAPGRKCIVGQNSALDAVCRPLFAQYIADITTLTEGIVVNDALDHNRMNTNKRAFVNQFVSRADFMAEYPSNMTAQAYIDKLEQTTGVVLQPAEETALMSDFNSPGSSCSGFTSGRACVLFKILDGTTTVSGGLLQFDTRYGKAYYDQEFNPAFVFVEYLAYLRRNADQAGYDHWLEKLNFYGNWRDAEMVRAFILSPEYRQRFGP